MIVTFEDVAKRINIKVDQSNTDLEVYVGGEHIDGNDLLVHRNAPIKGSTIGYQFQFGFEKGDVLFMTKNPHLRKASMVPFRGLCSIATFVIRTKSSTILLQEYLAIIMQTNDFWNYCEKHKSGGVNYFINWGTLAKYEFELPSIEEQKRIADRVWAAYRLKEAYKRLLVATDEMVKSQFLEWFGNPIGNEANRVKLSSICVINPRRNKELSDDMEISFVPMDKVNEDGTLCAFETKTVKEVKKGFTAFAENDVLFAKITPCMENGKGGIMTNLHNHYGFGSTEFHVLRPVADKSTSTWLYYLTKLEVFRVEASNNMTGTGGQKRVPASFLENVMVLTPPLSLQNQFADIVRQADKSKFELKRAIEAIDQVIKSLINS